MRNISRRVCGGIIATRGGIKKRSDPKSTSPTSSRVRRSSKKKKLLRRLSSGELGRERRRDSGAALAGSVQVLEGDEGSLDSRNKIVLGIACAKVDLDAWATEVKLVLVSHLWNITKKRKVIRTC
jgi:hypothetical protein